MSPVRSLARLVLRSSARLGRAVGHVRHAARLAVDGERATFAPEQPQKSLVRRLGDQALHLIRYGEVDTSYYVFGKDLVSNPDPLPYPAFREIRDRRNLVPMPGGYTYACLLRDKYVFGLYARSLGYPTPRTLARLGRERMTWTDGRGRCDLDAIAREDLDGFVKRVSGVGGKGAFSLRVRNGHLELDGEAATLDDLRRRIDQPYILQERVRQHPDLARLHPASLNTFRIVTVLEDGAARPFVTILRIGAGGSVMDNASSGGVGVIVDPEAGRTVGPGLVRIGGVGWVDAHPDTGVGLDGIELPFVSDCLDVACRFHEDLPGFYTLGWDIAMSPDGPVVIECNDNWGARLVAPLMPDFWEQFRELHDMRA